jgi:dTDP-4-dehydrorhamnose 3,5-epimerase
MIFEDLPLQGALLIRPNRQVDERGYFARTYCREAFLERGLKDCSLQCSASFNTHGATLRGLHFQLGEASETKLVRCLRGAVFDVMVDLRRTSSTFGQWHSETLTVENGLGLYIPQGFAHGFITLAEATEIGYQMADPFVPNAAAGIAWNDPDLAIDWPIAPRVISDKDRALPSFADLSRRLNPEKPIS